MKAKSFGYAAPPTEPDYVSKEPRDDPKFRSRCWMCGRFVKGDAVVCQECGEYEDRRIFEETLP